MRTEPRSPEPDETGLDVVRTAATMTITIDNAQGQNRLPRSTLSALERIAAQLQEDDGVHVVVVTGAGTQFFSSGILNPVLRASLSKSEIISLVRLANRAFDALEALPQIVIAALNGPARAGGAELALACDIRLAAEHAGMMFPEAAWGGFPGAGGPCRLASIVGRGRALELICTGRDVSATEMERLQLVQSVHPSAELSAAAATLAAQIASKGPLATRGAKRIIRARMEPGLQAARELSDALRHELEWSGDVDEAIAAHKENREPRFTGR